MIGVTGIRFRPAGKVYDFENAPFSVEVGDSVVVETQNGEDIGKVAYVNKKVTENEVSAELKTIVRKATAKDLEIQKKNEEKAIASLGIVKKKVRDSKLPMSIVDIEFSFDGSRVVVNFTSEERVDFRGLLKELAQHFKKRVELRQIGIRDETKLVGGLGVCGQPCCCKRFLDDFGHVSVKMAKNQNLSLNPQKISGLCGRLMCCLQYENGFYEEAQKDLPKLGGNVKTPEGNGKLISANILKSIGTVKFEKQDETTIKNFPLCDISKCSACENNCPAKQQRDEKQENSKQFEQNKNPKKFKQNNGGNNNGIQN